MFPRMVVQGFDSPARNKSHDAISGFAQTATNLMRLKVPHEQNVTIMNTMTMNAAANLLEQVLSESNIISRGVIILEDPARFCVAIETFRVHHLCPEEFIDIDELEAMYTRFLGRPYWDEARAEVRSSILGY